MLSRDERIDLRTQELVKMQLGDLALHSARQRAELEALRAEIAALTAPPPEPPSDQT